MVETMTNTTATAATTEATLTSSRHHYHQHLYPTLHQEGQERQVHHEQCPTIYNNINGSEGDEPTPFQNYNNDNVGGGGGSSNISCFYDIDSMIPDLFGVIDDGNDDIVVVSQQNQGGGHRQSHNGSTNVPSPYQSFHSTTGPTPSAEVQGLQDDTNNGVLPFKELVHTQQQQQQQQSCVFPGTQSTTQTGQDYPWIQYNPQQSQQQQQHQLLNSQQNIFQLLTMLNPLAAVSATPQILQHILQSLGLPRAVLMPVETNLAHSQVAATSTNGISQQQTQQQMQLQQMPMSNLQQLQQLQSLTFAQKTQLQQQQQHLPGQNQNCCNQGGRNTIFKSNSHVQSEPQNSNSNISTQYVNTTTVSNDTAAAAATKPFLNDPTSQSVSMTISQKSVEVDAMNKKTVTAPSAGSAVNGRTSSVATEHIKDSKTFYNVDDGNPFPVCMKNVQNVQRTTLQGRSRPTFVGTMSSSSRPSNFVSPPLDNDSGNVISTAQINLGQRKKVEPQIVNNKTAMMTSNTTTTTSTKTIPINCHSYDHHGTKPAKCSKGESCDLVAPTGTVDEQQDKATIKELYTTKKIPTCTIILPCRARGMPPDHNFKNAHFIIPPDVKHGQELVCSHAVCRQRGIKFRYCWECRIPVAKRNFHQRHSHGLEDGTVALGRTVDVRSSVTTHAITSLCLNEKCKKEMDVTKAANNSHSFHRTLGTNKIIVATQQSPMTSSISTSESPSYPKRVGGDSHASKAHSLGDSSIGDKSPAVQKIQWATLLDRRPSEDDSQGMSAWLLEVMEVSDRRMHLTRDSHFDDGACSGEDATSDSSPFTHQDAEDGSNESDGVSSVDQDLSEYKFHAGNPFSESTSQKHNQVSGSQSSVDLYIANDFRSRRGTRGLKRKLPSSIEVSKNSAYRPHLGFGSAEEDSDDKTEGSGVTSDET